MKAESEQVLKEQIEALEAAMGQADFWVDKAKAQATIKELGELKAKLAGAGQYDRDDVVITIFAGAGGDDAEDFAAMLFAMYRKFAAKQGIDLTLIHENQNDHGGYRNLTFELNKKGAYGLLKNESGVHRLVRVSPFNAKNLRHTSFALVEVIPRFVKQDTVAIDEKDLKVEFARSSGPGGQNVNKRETAVRLTHTPTGLTVHADGERSQAQNRDKALAILRGKLYKRQEEERQKKEQGMYISKTMEIEWGSQIRSYVLHPYKMVKDHRTGVETADITGVLEGELEPFLEAEKDL